MSRKTRDRVWDNRNHRAADRTRSRARLRTRGSFARRRLEPGPRLDEREPEGGARIDGTGPLARFRELTAVGPDPEIHDAVGAGRGEPSEISPERKGVVHAAEADRGIAGHHRYALPGGSSS